MSYLTKTRRKKSRRRQDLLDLILGVVAVLVLIAFGVCVAMSDIAGHGVATL